MKEDDGIVTAVFKGHNLPIPAELKGVSGTTAVEKFDQTICQLVKRRNALHYLKCSRAKVLANLEFQLQHMGAEKDSFKGTQEIYSKLHQLDNKIDEVTMKIKDSKYIGKTYQAILDTLQKVKRNYSCG